MHHRFPRIVGALGLAIALSSGMLASTAVASNPAGWLASVTPEPSKVSAGDSAAFLVKFVNQGPSNISQLYLTAATPKDATFIVATPSQGTCNTSGPLYCDLGAVNADASASLSDPEVTITIVYQTPASGSSMPITFQLNTTGVASDKGNNSHGDAYNLPTSVTLSTSNRDFAGRYIYDSSFYVFTDPSFSHRNPHSTAVTAPGTDMPVTVADQDGSTYACPADIASDCFGQWSVVSVDSGEPFPATGFQVVLGFSHFELHGGVNAGNIQIVHLISADPGYELITQADNTCTSATPDVSEMPCMIPEQDGNDVIVTLWLLQNGPIRGW